ncbi:MAG: HlyC/CorC family transporter [Bacteroidetes bacterium]|uniref:HlyC/CorC family transporter n=1 Tax=Phaeocystidibacter marisrubri TaxID=1577780 RepID=A0A6L3ZDQ8_9FLAO|nr:hemolysin family protein [Phaeocystidibacter marisrubri]KAB2815810.1 HlyC/CorC family transporter [Phaeocystidibacter marisrubri]TNE28544.1 MAG: HlyC/CorC family transporter [Bacteroidota bacterium]GGH65817.1 hemolysin [Phaeocystidibacter marisrubri]
MAEPYIVILLALLASAFFSGMEIAFLSANRLQIELESKKRRLPNIIISYLVKHPTRFISTMLVGNNVAIVLFGLYLPDILSPYFQWTDSEYLVLLLQTIISTVVVLFLAEYLPKALFSARSNEGLKAFSIPVVVFYLLTYPIVSGITSISKYLLRVVFKTNLDSDQPVFSKVDIDHYIEENTNNDDEEVDHEIEIFRNALDFSDIKAREFMIPRTEILAAEKAEGISELHRRFIETGYSKIIVYNENIDNIIGYVHAYELFKKPENIRSILRPVSFIPETMTANDVLNLFTRDKRNMAIVLDEFGGTAGLITLEDVVEEIFGDIDDEHDTDELLERQVGPNEYIFSARLEIDYLNDEYRFSLPESDNYTTLGGLVTDMLESIPEKGERVALDDYILEVHDVSSNRLEEVRVLVR